MSLTVGLFVQELVKRLYDFNNHYFETHDISSASVKVGELEKLLAETLEKIHQLEGGC